MKKNQREEYEYKRNRGKRKEVKEGKRE
jgi:hypothetical protein